VRVTDPAVRVFRRLIPGYRGLDFASLVLALVAQCICTALLMVFSGSGMPGVGLVITWSVVGLLSFILNIYFWSLMISIIASFIAPYSGHPALVLVRQITEPCDGAVSAPAALHGRAGICRRFLFFWPYRL
jgi:YggT family protein